VEVIKERNKQEENANAGIAGIFTTHLTPRRIAAKSPLIIVLHSSATAKSTELFAE
jgi:hypothetical protein